MSEPTMNPHDPIPQELWDALAGLRMAMNNQTETLRKMATLAPAYGGIERNGSPMFGILRRLRTEATATARSGADLAEAITQLLALAGEEK